MTDGMNKSNNKITFIDRLMAVYILYNAISVIWLLKSGMPFKVYAEEFVVSLLPMIFYFVGRSFKDKKSGFLRNLIIAVIVVGVPGMILWINSGNAGFFSLPGAISIKSEQWVAGFGNMYSTWLGNGLGANGRQAVGLEDAHIVSDGGLVKAFCEQGIFGFSMVIYMIIVTFRKGFKDLKSFWVWIGITALVLLMSIWSNILSFPLVGSVFWFAIGCINSGADGDVKGADKEQEVVKETGS